MNSNNTNSNMGQINANKANSNSNVVSPKSNLNSQNSDNNYMFHTKQNQQPISFPIPLVANTALFNNEYNRLNEK